MALFHHWSVLTGRAAVTIDQSVGVGCPAAVNLGFRVRLIEAVKNQDCAASVRKIGLHSAQQGIIGQRGQGIILVPGRHHAACVRVILGLNDVVRQGWRIGVRERHLRDVEHANCGSPCL